ncbi:DUF4240 domain-containing protein [Bacillus mycoides]|uniref:DUF4240 domain-containing protein n=1 Tax=Bacillus mycoides TaxID=1405 RepID=UPI003D005113
MEKEKNNKVSIGDVFAVTLSDGRFGAIRVLDHTDKSYLLATTPYIGNEIPSIDIKGLGEFLMQNRFFYENEIAMTWVDGEKPTEHVYVGNIPLKNNKKVKCNIYSGNWSNFDGAEVLLEWRWENDREQFQKEIEEEEKRLEEEFYYKPQIPKTMMTDDAFWSILSLLNLDEKDEDSIVETAVSMLSKMYVKDIKQFEETLAYKLYLLDTKEHAENIGEHSYNERTEDYFSSDVFLYSRCSVVAQGKAYYEECLKKPQNMPKDTSFEPLLFLADEAYTRRTGKEFEYMTGCNYESFSNVEGWK